MCKPNNYPKIVYKYRNWNDNFHKDVLKKNHLFLASPKSFNDPIDCRIPTNYTSLDTNMKIQSFVDSFILKHSDYLLELERNITDERTKLKNQIKKDLLNFQKKNEDILFDYQDKYYGILSLSSKWNNILMWSHYANMHKGYCVGFWEEKLRNSNLFGKGGPVIYPTDDNFPFIDPLKNDLIDNAFKETHYKAKDWEYEKEYRLTKIFEFNIDKTTDNNRTIKIPDDFFAEIIIGLETSIEDCKEIIEIAKGKNIKLFKIVKNPFKFLLDRIQIY